MTWECVERNVLSFSTGGENRLGIKEAVELFSVLHASPADG